MGNCLSDVEGGKQAVGGVGHHMDPTAAGVVVGGGPNDAVDLLYRTKGLHALYTSIELSLSASKLRDLDIVSKSDPMAVVSIRKRDATPEELGRTEVIVNNLDPVWIQRINIMYQFETVQTLIFHVYDVDKDLKLKDQDFLSEGNCVLSELYYGESPVLASDLDYKDICPSKDIVLEALQGHKCSNILNFLVGFTYSFLYMRRAYHLTIHSNSKNFLIELPSSYFTSDCNQAQPKFNTESAQQEWPCPEKLRGTYCSCRRNDHLKNCCTDDISMHQPGKQGFILEKRSLRISRIVDTGGSVPICKTEVVNNNLNPIWRPVCLTMQQFVNKDNPLVLECFDFNSSGNHVLIGKLQKTVADLENLRKSRVGANFISPPSGFRGNEKVLKGQLFVEGFAEKQLYSFVDYISSGFELSFMVAVDFTASNGNPRSPDSLHYIDPSGRLNAYQRAILEVGDVIQFYGSDKRFPAWGFGGKVEGVGGIMAAYASALQNFTLSGPTLFGDVVNKAAEISAESLKYNQSKYFVLLIITDGVLTDMQETKDALVRASDLPLSILIVGVGSSDFTQMEIFDADNGYRLESSTGRVSTRDIVQFVPMREVHSGQISVVQALLEELPGQFLTYMRCRDIRLHNISAAQTSAPGLSYAV